MNGYRTVIPTFTGKRFDIFNPNPKHVDIEDIAHGLSQECRYSAQSRVFYSVAEHSVHVSIWAEKLVLKDSVWNAPLTVELAKTVGLWGLVHDASEAYGLRDLSPPVLRNASWGEDYRRQHRRVMDAVCEHFDLDDECPDEVHEADRRIVPTEWKLLIHPSIPYTFYQNPHPLPLPVSLALWSPADAKSEFLARYRSLRE